MSAACIKNQTVQVEKSGIRSTARLFHDPGLGGTDGGGDWGNGGGGGGGGDDVQLTATPPEIDDVAPSSARYCHDESLSSSGQNAKQVTRSSLNHAGCPARMP